MPRRTARATRARPFPGGTPDRAAVRTLAFWDKDRFLDDFEYPLAHTPCENVIGGKFCHFPHRVAEAFPQQHELKHMGIESYMGVPLLDGDDRTLGHLYIMDDRPMPPEPRYLAAFRIFGARAAAELIRANLEHSLAQSEQRLHDLFDQAPIAYVHEGLDSRFIRANNAALRILGLRRDQIEGTYGKTFAPDTPDAQRRIREAFESVGRGTHTPGAVLELRRRDNNKPVWIQWWSNPDVSGAFTRTMFLDITDRVLMETEKERLEAQNKRLEEDLKAAHDFDTIVGSSPALLRVLESVQQVAPTSSPSWYRPAEPSPVPAARLPSSACPRARSAAGCRSLESHARQIQTELTPYCFSQDSDAISRVRRDRSRRVAHGRKCRIHHNTMQGKTLHHRRDQEVDHRRRCVAQGFGRGRKGRVSVTFPGLRAGTVPGRRNRHGSLSRTPTARHPTYAWRTPSTPAPTPSFHPLSTLPRNTPMKIKDSIAVVTGANRGIGRAFVEQLLARGAKRVYAGARDPSMLKDLVASGGGRVVALKIDVTDPASVKAAASSAKDVTLLINNAGALEAGSQLSAEIAGIRKDFETNYFGTINMVRAFTPALEVNKNGTIVNVLSVVAFASMPGLGGYSASKAAAHSLTLALRGELGKKRISVHGTYPGPVDTDMAKGVDLPKTPASEVAGVTLDGVEAGQEYIFPDPMAKQVYQGWRADHAAVEAQFGSM